MRTIDHFAYAELMTYHLEVSPLHKLALWIGCVMPDFNKFSYMGHSLRDWSLGHSFRVRNRDIVSFFQQPYRGSLLWWFQAGIKFHYLGDSFSRPHNPEFAYDSPSHIAYEWRLHEETRKVLRDRPYPPAHVHGSLGQWLDRRHSKYLKVTQDVRDDAYYIDTTLMGVWEEVRKKIGR